MNVQERIRIPDDKMAYYKDLAEMYVGDDVSPDFYGWVFPKYDHVAVGAHPSPVFHELPSTLPGLLDLFACRRRQKSGPAFSISSCKWKWYVIVRSCVIFILL